MRDERQEVRVGICFVKKIQRVGTKFESVREFLKKFSMSSETQPW